MKYKILIIDDEYGKRKKRYEKLFNEADDEFDYIATTRLDKIAKESKTSHLALVDMMLEPGKNIPLTLMDTNIVNLTAGLNLKYLRHEYNFSLSSTTSI